MRRKLSLLMFAVIVTVITACSNATAPNRATDDEMDDSSEFCGVVAGTQTCPRDSIY